METSPTLRSRAGQIVAMTIGLLGLGTAALAQTMPTGSDGVTTIGDTFESSVSDFTTLVVDLAPYLFGGLLSILVVRLAIRWFGRVTNAV